MIIVCKIINITYTKSIHLKNPHNLNLKKIKGSFKVKKTILSNF